MLIRLKKKWLEKITGSKNAHIIFHEILSRYDYIDRDKEHFFVIGLRNNNTIKYIDEVTVGTLICTIAEPREAYRRAICKGVCSIIIGHNHPSGQVAPSERDVELTKRFTEAGKIIGIELLDHIIFCNGKEYYSFKDEGKM
ncbi:MAG: JAB domain-containing protein [Bacteroidales bacterium]|nr:JAB domain-containing protein [Bacteroidales bacterium]